MPDTKSNVAIVKKLYDASVRRDYDMMRSLLHTDYTLKDPMMTLRSADELIEMMKKCPAGRIENLSFVAEDDKVVGVFDGVTEEPAPSRLRMCSVITLENGKVRSEEMFYDTAQIPPEIASLMEGSIPHRPGRPVATH